MNSANCSCRTGVIEEPSDYVPGELALEGEPLGEQAHVDSAYDQAAAISISHLRLLLQEKESLIISLEQQLRDAIITRDRILRCRSWRITAPLRVVGRQCRRLLKHGWRSSPPWLRKRLKGLRPMLTAASGGRLLMSSDQDQWTMRFEEREILAAQTMAKRFQAGPLLSILMPVYNTDPSFLRAAIESVQAQFYQNWELCIADDASTDSTLLEVLAELSQRDQRIRVSRLEKNGGISAASNRALTLARGEYCVLMDNDDLLAPHALLEIARIIAAQPDTRFIYSDEDKIDMAGNRYDFFFKPDWSPDLMTSCNYLNHLSAIHADLLRAVGDFRSEYDGSQDYDLFLRVVERTKIIVHIPKILYHWRAVPGSTADTPTAKMGAHTSAQKALQAAIKRRGLAATVEPGFHLGYWRVRYEIARDSLVSVLLPTGGNLKLLRQCLRGLQQQTSYQHLEVIIVDNSACDEVKKLFDESIHNEFSARYLDFRNAPFNYSILNNRAAEIASGEFLLLLNDDIYPINRDWIESMIEHAQRPEVGAVGARLLYPDDTIQHAGVVIGLHGCCDHIFRRCTGAEGAYLSFPHIVRNWSAVTAACLMLRKEVFREVAGFDELELAVAFQDVDLCLKLAAAGYYNVYTPHAELYHLESVTKAEKIPAHSEVTTMVERWSHVMARDPFYNRNLSRRGYTCRMRTEA